MVANQSLRALLVVSGLVLALGLVMPAQSLHAQNAPYFNGVQSPDLSYGNAANWSTGSVPTAYAVIDSSQIATLSSGTITQSSWLLVGAGNSWGNPGGSGTMLQSGGSLYLGDVLYVGLNYGAAQSNYVLSGTGSTNSNYLRIGQNGWASFTQSGNSSVTVRNGGDANEVNIGGWGGTGSYTLSDNATFNGTYMVVGGDNAGYYGTYGSGNGVLTVNGNANIGLTNWMVVGWGGGATGTVNINGGLVNLNSTGNNYNNRMHLGWGGGTGYLHLNGGNLMTSEISTNGAGYLYLNGGKITVQTNIWGNALIYNLNAAYVQAGGAIIDTNGNNTSITQALLADPNSPGGGLDKQGVGTLTLGGANTYSGPTNIEAGTLRINNALALQNSTLVSSGGVLDLNGYNALLAGLSGGSTLDTLNGGTLTVGNNNVSSAFAGALTGNAALVKTGAGTLTLSGANVYGGATTINNGTLLLDFSAPGAPASNILPAGTAVSFNGSTLAVTGSPSAANSQTLGNLTFNGVTNINVTLNGAASLALAADNTWTRNAGSAVNVNLNGATLTSSPATNAHGLVVGTGSTAFATVNGTDWAAVSGGQVVAYTGYSTDSYVPGANTDITAADPAPATISSDTLAFRTAQANTLTLPGVVTLGAGGVLVGSQVGANATGISGGTLTSATNELLIHQFNTAGALTINSVLGDNGANSMGLTKAGPGTLVLTGANTYSGPTIVGGGSLQGSTATIPGAVTLQGRANVNYNQASDGALNVIVSGNGSLTKSGLGALNITQLQTYSGPTYITSGTLRVTPSTTTGMYEGLVSNGNGYDTSDSIPQTSIQSVARWGNSTSGGGNNVYPAWGDNTTWGYTGYINNTSGGNVTYEFGKNFDDGAYLKIDGTVVVNNDNWNWNVLGSITLSPGMHTFDLRFGQGGGGVGPNTGAYNNFGISYNTVGNTGTGGTWLQMGVNDPNTVFYASGAAAGLPGASAVVLSSNTTLDLSDSGIGAATIGSLADAVPGATTGHQVLLGGNMLSIGSDNTNTTFSGNISGVGGALTKFGNGTLTLSGSNGYTGMTTVQAGVLQVGSNTALPSASPLSITGGALDVQNLTPSVPSLTMSGGTILSSGGGALNVAAGASITGPASVASGAAVNVTGDLNLTNGTIGGGGTVNGSGNMNLSGNCGVGGTANVQVPGYINHAGGSFTVAAGATVTAPTVQQNGGSSVTWNVNGTLATTTANVATAGGGNWTGNSAVLNVNSGGKMTTTTMNVGFTYNFVSNAYGTVNVASGGTLSAGNIVMGYIGYGYESCSATINVGGVLNAVNMTGASWGYGYNSSVSRIINVNAGGQLNATTIDLSSMAWFGDSYNRQLNLSGGTLANVAGSNLTVDSTTPVTLIGNSTISAVDANSVTISGPTRGIGGLTVNGVGAVNLNGVNSYSGPTNVLAGTLNHSGGTVSGPVTVSGGVMNVNGATTSGPVAVSGGILNVNHAMTTGGATTVNSGSLNVNSALTTSGLSIGAGTVHLLNAANVNPSSIAGLTVWLDATSLSGANNQTITTWSSKVGGAGDFTGQANLYTTGGAGFNNRPVVHFNGSGELVNNTDFSSNSTVMYVGAMDGTQNARLVSANNNWLLGYWGGNMDCAYGVNNWVAQGGGATTATELYEATIDSSGNFTAYNNGTVIGSAGGMVGPNGLVLGGWGNYGNPSEQSQGSIGEVLVFNGVLSPADRRAVEAYLDYKWFGTNNSGSLPSTTPVAFTGAGALDLNGVSQTIASLSGSNPGSQVILGGGALTVGDSTNTAFAGAISDMGGTSTAVGGSLIKVGSGMLTLSGNSNYSGGTTILNGTLQLGSSTALGTGNLAVNSGTLDLGGNGVTVPSFSGAAGVVTNNMSATLATLTVNQAGNTIFSGSIADGAGQVGLSKTGTGTLTLTSANTYSGPTVIAGGVLSAGANVTLSPNSAVTITGGTLDASGAAQTIASLAMTSGGALNLSYNTLLTCTGSAGFSGTLDVSNDNGAAVLVSYAPGSESGRFTTVNGLTSGYRLDYESTQLAVILAGPPTWTNTAGGSWNTGGNWVGNIVPGTAPGQQAVVGAATTLPVTITLDTAQTLGSLTFASSSSSGYTLTPGVSGTGSLTMATSDSTASQILVTSGSHLISANVTLTGSLMVTPAASTTLEISGNMGESIPNAGILVLSNSSAGTLILSGSNGFNGGTVVEAGTLVLTNNEALAEGSSLTIGDASAFTAGPGGAGAAAAGSAAVVLGSGPNEVTALPSITPVPEPGTLVLVLAGLIAGLATWRRRRNRNN